MLKLFTRTTPTDAKDTIKWVQIVKRPGTTAPIETLWEKKSGSYVTHAKHKKVMLIDKPSPSKLTVKLSTNEHVVVDAADCGPPFSANVKTTSDYNTVGRMSNLCHDCGCAKKSCCRGPSTCLLPSYSKPRRPHVSVPTKH
jgi:hypothetical protein